MPAIGLLRVVSNTQLEQRSQIDRKPREIPMGAEAMDGLASHIEKFWQSAWQAKLPIERQILANLRQRDGIYEPHELALIRQQGGSEVYMMLTSAKCRGAESWLREILCSETDRPWGLDPTPIPDLPPAVSKAIVQNVAELAIAAKWDVDDARIDDHLLKLKSLAQQRMKDIAAKIAERHTTRIADQFMEGGFEDAMSDCIYDLVTHPACFMRGPTLRMKLQRHWIAGADGKWYSDVKRTPRYEFRRRSPLDIYPAPAATDLQSKNLIDRFRFTREDFQELIGLPGYSKEKILEILELYGTKGYNSHPMNETQRAILELRPNEEYDLEGHIEVLDFWGSVSGAHLKEWSTKTGQALGMKIEDHREYQIEALKTAGIVFKATINPHPLGWKPYMVANFEEKPGSVWGKGLPELMRDSAAMCNGSARAIANNAALASGPMVEVQVDRLADGERITRPSPWKVYQTVSDRQGANRNAVNFWQASMNVGELLQIYNHFSREADNTTGFPNYSYGDSRVGGAGRTSSGLAQLLGTVNKGVRRVVATVDRKIIKIAVSAMYDENMEHDPDPTIKGDLRAAPKGTAAVLIKEQAHQRRMEMLQSTMNPLDAGIIGVKGRTEMLRSALAGADFDATKIIPDGLDLELMQAMLPPAQELAGGMGPNAPAPEGMTTGGAEPGMQPGAPEGMSPNGGTPAAPPTRDLAGNAPNGVDVRQQQLGMADGGVVAGESALPAQRRYRLIDSPDGEPIVERIE